MKTAFIPFNMALTPLALLCLTMLLKTGEDIGMDPTTGQARCDCSKMAQLEAKVNEMSEQIQSIQGFVAAFSSVLKDDTWLRAPLVGPPGPKGEPGSPGIDGVNGAKGVRGDNGQKGEKGHQDPNGVQGPKGEPGAYGPKGEFGPQGTKGNQGNVGPVGPRGNDGQKGDKGHQGPSGVPGQKGERGANGQKGDNGPQGIKGYQGSTGSPGPKGAQGERGSQGGSADCIRYNDKIKLYNSATKKVLDDSGTYYPILSKAGAAPSSQDWKIRRISDSRYD